MDVFEPERLAEYSDEAILSEIKRIAKTNFGGKCPRIVQFDKFSRVHSSTIRKRFGSWAEAMRLAGFSYGRHIYDISDLRIDLFRIRDLNGGRYFSQSFYERNGGKYSPETLIARFGHRTWASLLANLLGLKKQWSRKTAKPRPAPLTEEALLGELKRVWQIFNRRPSYAEFKKFGRIGVKAYEVRFGTWSRAIEELCTRCAVGVHGRPGLHVTSDMLKSELAHISASANAPRLDFATYRKNGGTYSIGTFQHHFGSWKKAVQSIGQTDGHSVNWRSDEEYFSELQRVWEKIGRQPHARELRQFGSMISSQGFQRRFGSWMKAIHAFCRDRVGEPGEPNGIEQKKEDSGSLQPAISPGSNDVRNESTLVSPESTLMSTPRNPSPRLRFRVFMRDNFTCMACGRSPQKDPAVRLEPDHIIPYSKGGETVFENLRTLCSECNRGKSDLT